MREKWWIKNWDSQVKSWYKFKLGDNDHSKIRVINELKVMDMIKSGKEIESR